MDANPTSRRARAARVAGRCAAVVMLFLGGCAAPLDWRPIVESDPEAVALLEASSTAHGGDAFAALRDVSVSYTGTWHSGVARIQPDLVDIEHRGSSEERLLFGDDGAVVVGQRHRASAGPKQVLWNDGAVRVWYGDAPNEDPEQDRASAAVAEAYTMFLTAPHYLLRRAVAVDMAGPVLVDGHRCDQVLAVLRPGLGLAEEDRVLVAIDREQRLVRRVCFSLEGLESTRGVLAEVRLREHRTIGGIVWPTRFVETVLRPVRLMVHRWQVTGLDLDRGLSIDDLAGPSFTGPAAPPADPLPDPDAADATDTIDTIGTTNGPR